MISTSQGCREVILIKKYKVIMISTSHGCCEVLCNFVYRIIFLFFLRGWGIMLDACKFFTLCTLSGFKDMERILGP